MNRALVDHARLERLADTLMSAVHHGLAAEQRLERLARLHVGVVPLKQRFDVSAVERLDYALERLDVLLRHRLTQYLADATQKSPQADAGEDAMVNRADGGGHLGAPKPTLILGDPLVLASLSSEARGVKSGGNRGPRVPAGA